MRRPLVTRASLGRRRAKRRIDVDSAKVSSPWLPGPRSTVLFEVSGGVSLAYLGVGLLCGLRERRRLCHLLSTTCCDGRLQSLLPILFGAGFDIAAMPASRLPR